MTGVLFIVCVPRAEYEKILKSEQIEDKKKNIIPSRLNTLKGVFKCQSDVDLNVKKSEKIFKCASDVNIPSDLDARYEGEEGIEEQSRGSNIPKNRQMHVSIEENEQTIPPFDPHTPLETILKELLDRLHVQDAVWCPGKENKYYQVFFSIECGAVCEEALQLLSSFGIGTRSNSVVSVIPCALYYRASSHVHVDTGAEPERHGSTAWSRFVSSVRSRTTLAQLLQDVRADATLTFDWLFLLIVAAFVAAIGLVENSTVFLVASMLISPLMGPIMACAVGTAVRDASLQRMGLVHELFGLFLALVIGFLFGLVLCAIGDNYGEEVWPTDEMISRCEVRSLWVGVLIALPSAAAVALAVLGGYTASLVGVAISASLLPPAVNAGLLWSMAVTSLFSDNSQRWDLGNTTFYSNNLSAEIAVHGTVSLCLTIVNILCIYVGGVMVYKIKEVAPMEPKDMKFWRSERGATTSGSAEHIASVCGNIRSPTIMAWDYFGWCHDRVSLSRRCSRRAPAPDRRHHDTWSPYSLDPQSTLPRASDIERLWRQQMDAPHKTPYGRTAPVSSETAEYGYRQFSAKTSQHSASINTDSTSVQSISTQYEPTKDEAGSGNIESATANKVKFTVTPAYIDL